MERVVALLQTPAGVVLVTLFSLIGVAVSIALIQKQHIARIVGIFLAMVSSILLAAVLTVPQLVPPTTRGPQVEPPPAQPSTGDLSVTPRPFVSSPPNPWVVDLAPVPDAGTDLSWDVKAGQTAMVTGGQFQIAGQFCGGNSAQICVLIVHATRDQRLTVSAVIPRQNWLGVAANLEPAAVLAEKRALLFLPPNCVTGCRIADVLVFTDTTLVSRSRLTGS